MKKFCFSFAAIACAMTVFVSCSDNDEPDGPNPEVPKVTEGVYILNEGNYSLNLEGGLNMIDYATGKYEMNLFKKANGKSLGNTPQCGIVYGSKIYIGVCESKVIHILDRNTYKTVKQLNLEDSDKGSKPRSLVAKDGKVYISMYEGYVARLDTVSCEIDASVRVGDNPEEIAIVGNKLYVPNSEGMNWEVGYGTTASVINLASFTVEKTFTVPLNPYTFLSNGKDLFLICRGNYFDVKAGAYRVNEDGTYKQIGTANLGAINGNEMYLIDFPWGGTPTYYHYDIAKDKMTQVEFNEIPAPTSVGIDPNTGNIVFTADIYEGGQQQTFLPGKVFLYDNNRKLVKEYDGLVGRGSIFFNIK